MSFRRYGKLTIFGMMWLALFTVGCGLIPAGEDNDCSGEGYLFSDDFGGEQRCGWVDYDDPGGTVELVDGVLQISSKEQDQFWFTNPGREFDDVIIITQARQASGPDDNAYGVICRYQNLQNFYVFLISGDGYYAIGKYQTGSDQIIYLTENSEYQYSDVINQGVATNEIRVSCVGSELSLTVNGILLETVSDSTFVRGDVGVGVTTFQPGTAIVQYDSIRVLAP